MSLYPTVYNQNASDDDKDSGMMDLGLDDGLDVSPMHSEYADGEEEAKTQKEVEIVGS